jgi:alkylated DNA nucleotide flippase Atl1
MGVKNGSQFPTLPNILDRHQRILDQIPASDLNQNERQVAVLIARIPYGKVASYGKIAEWAQSKYGYSGGNARVVANIRMKLYGILEHYTDYPLWRLATSSDEQASNDSVLTRIFGMERRVTEGSWNNPIWFDPFKYHDPYP